MKYLTISLGLLLTFNLDAQNIGSHRRMTHSITVKRTNIKGKTPSEQSHEDGTTQMSEENTDPTSKEKNGDSKKTNASSENALVSNNLNSEKTFLHSGMKFFIRKKLTEDEYIIRPGKIHLKKPKFLFQPEFWGLSNSAIEYRKKTRDKIKQANMIFSRSHKLRALDHLKSDYIYAKLSKEELEEFSKNIPSRFQAVSQMAIIPFKYRSYTKEFEAEVNLNALFGVKINLDEFGIHNLALMGGVGSSSVAINRRNIDMEALENRFKDSLASEAFLEDNTRRSAISITYSVVYTYKNLSMGLYRGWDYLIPDNSLKWKNNGVPWTGFGIGYSFFNNTEQKKF